MLITADFGRDARLTHHDNARVARCGCGAEPPGENEGPIPPTAKFAEMGRNMLANLARSTVPTTTTEHDCWMDGTREEPGTTREVGTITVMFTDLAGSTAMRARLGEEAADRLRGVHDALLADAITSNGGRVVKHLGDGFMASFPSAAGALGAAGDRPGQPPGSHGGNASPGRDLNRRRDV